MDPKKEKSLVKEKRYFEGNWENPNMDLTLSDSPELLFIFLKVIMV